MDDVIALMRESYNHSNITDRVIDLPLTPLDRLAAIIEKSEPMSTTNFKDAFSGMKSYFIHKLISERTLEQRFKLRPEDFFKGAIYVDYVCSLLLDGNYDLINRNNFATKSLKELAFKSADYFPTLKTTATEYPEDNSIIEPGFCAKATAAALMELTKTDTAISFYEKAKNINDVKACIFIDTICDILSDDSCNTKIISSLEQGFYYSSIVAYSELFLNKCKVGTHVN